MGLRTWDKPAAACLASRVPVRDRGIRRDPRTRRACRSSIASTRFAQLRVRHYDDTARIEVDLDDLPRVIDHRDEIVDATKRAGYRYVTVDLEGFRSGNLNG